MHLPLAPGFAQEATLPPPLCVCQRGRPSVGRLPEGLRDARLCLGDADGARGCGALGRIWKATGCSKQQDCSSIRTPPRWAPLGADAAVSGSSESSGSPALACHPPTIRVLPCGAAFCIHLCCPGQLRRLPPALLGTSGEREATGSGPGSLYSLSQRCAGRGGGERSSPARRTGLGRPYVGRSRQRVLSRCTTGHK